MKRANHTVAAVAVTALLVLPSSVRAQDEQVPDSADAYAEIVRNLGLEAWEIVDILSRHSLMLSEAQAERIEDAKAAARSVEQERLAFVGLTEGATLVTPIAIRDFKLEAIMYFSRERWTVWINGEAITPDRMPEDVRIRRVTAALVEIAWTPNPALPDDVREFTLLPGQIYLAASGQVVETSQQVLSAPASSEATGDGGMPAEQVEPSGPVATPESLEMSTAQQAQLEQLQQALGLLGGNGAAVGLTDEELQSLQASMASGNELTVEQAEQLQRIQQNIGATP